MTSYPVAKPSFGLNIRKAERGFIVHDPSAAGIIQPEWAFNTIEELASWLIEYYAEPQQ
jgi:hypothetical protein